MLDKFVYEEALALYTVNRQLGFTRYNVRARRVPGEHGALVKALTLLRHARGAGAMEVPHASGEVA